MIPELAAAMEAGESVVLATVVRTSRSVPRRPGAKMLVWADGRTLGTVGGGEMEHRVRTEAAAALIDGRPRLLTYRLVDPTSGDPGVCGGEADIYLEPFMPKPTLVVIGAGHVGQAVIDLAELLDQNIAVWDDRDDVLADATGEIDAASSGPIAEFLDGLALTPQAAIVIVTRNVALDLEILPALLATPAGYIGLMGSERRWATTRAGLVERGFDESTLARVQAPIGVEIHAETPAEIAVSIMASVIERRRRP